MPLHRVHEYVVNKNTQTIEKMTEYPLRDYGAFEPPEDMKLPPRKATEPEPHEPVQVQLEPDGLHFYLGRGPTAQEVGADDVPPYILEHLKRVPLTRSGERAAEAQTMKTCKWCPDTHGIIPSGQWEAHLLAHLEKSGLAARPEAPPRAAVGA